jgi:hypothetical protein
MNRYYTAPDGTRQEISADELNAELARLAALPEYVHLKNTGLRLGTDDDVDGIVTIRSRAMKVQGRIRSETYQTYIKLVGTEEARAHLVDEGGFSDMTLDAWDKFVARVEHEKKQTVS